MDLLISLAVMFAVVGPLAGWIVWADRRQRRRSGAPRRAEKEEVA
jgi:uncharacterized iron-regulated membrane protein